MDKNNDLIEKDVIEYVKEKDKSKKHYYLIFIILIFIISLLFVWISDYRNIKEKKEPKYCIFVQVHEYNDGNVTECIGLGYKIYKYERISIPKTTDFGTIFMKMKQK